MYGLDRTRRAAGDVGRPSPGRPSLIQARDSVSRDSYFFLRAPVSTGGVATCSYRLGHLRRVRSRTLTTDGSVSGLSRQEGVRGSVQVFTHKERLDTVVVTVVRSLNTTPPVSGGTTNPTGREPTRGAPTEVVETRVRR